MSTPGVRIEWDSAPFSNTYISLPEVTKTPQESSQPLKMWEFPKPGEELDLPNIPAVSRPALKPVAPRTPAEGKLMSPRSARTLKSSHTISSEPSQEENLERKWIIFEHQKKGEAILTLHITRLTDFVAHNLKNQSKNKCRVCGKTHGTFFVTEESALYDKLLERSSSLIRAFQACLESRNAEALVHLLKAHPSRREVCQALSGLREARPKFLSDLYTITALGTPLIVISNYFDGGRKICFMDPQTKEISLLKQGAFVKDAEGKSYCYLKSYSVPQKEEHEAALFRGEDRQLYSVPYSEALADIFCQDRKAKWVTLSQWIHFGEQALPYHLIMNEGCWIGGSKYFDHIYVPGLPRKALFICIHKNQLCIVPRKYVPLTIKTEDVVQNEIPAPITLGCEITFPNQPDNFTFEVRDSWGLNLGRKHPRSEVEPSFKQTINYRNRFCVAKLELEGNSQSEPGIFVFNGHQELELNKGEFEKIATQVEVYLDEQNQPALCLQENFKSRRFVSLKTGDNPILLYTKEGKKIQASLECSTVCKVGTVNQFLEDFNHIISSDLDMLIKSETLTDHWRSEGEETTKKESYKCFHFAEKLVSTCLDLNEFYLLLERKKQEPLPNEMACSITSMQLSES